MVILFCSKSPYTPEKYSTPTRKSLPNRNGAYAMADDVGNIRHSHIEHYRIAGDISDSDGDLTSTCKTFYSVNTTLICLKSICRNDSSWLKAEFLKYITITFVVLEKSPGCNLGVVLFLF